jgi:hypothetical protein
MHHMSNQPKHWEEYSENDTYELNGSVAGNTKSRHDKEKVWRELLGLRLIESRVCQK